MKQLLLVWALLLGLTCGNVPKEETPLPENIWNLPVIKDGEKTSFQLYMGEGYAFCDASGIHLFIFNLSTGNLLEIILPNNHSWDMRFLEVNTIQPKQKKGDLPKDFDLEDYIRSKPSYEIKKQY